MSESLAHTIVDSALARRRLQSRQLLSSLIDNLVATASNKYDQVRVRTPSCPEWETKGWIIGTTSITGENLSVVVTPSYVLYAGHLTIQHDATTENTVTVIPDEAGVAPADDVQRAIDDVLNWPEHIAAHLDRMIARNRKS